MRQSPSEPAKGVNQRALLLLLGRVRGRSLCFASGRADIRKLTNFVLSLFASLVFFPFLSRATADGQLKGIYLLQRGQTPRQNRRPFHRCPLPSRAVTLAHDAARCARAGRTPTTTFRSTFACCCALGKREPQYDQDDVYIQTLSEQSRIVCCNRPIHQPLAFVAAATSSSSSGLL